MSDLVDHGDATTLHMQCPLCHDGVVHSGTGIAEHTPTQLAWVRIPCTGCGRLFTLTAQRHVAP